MNRIHIFSIVFIVVLLSTQSASSTSNVFQKIGVQSIDIGIDEIELLNDPLLNTSQEVTPMGNSLSFSSEYIPSPDGVTENQMQLSWNHTAGSNLDFKDSDDLDYNYPECNDFIYFEQSFEWSSENIPTIVEYGATFRVNVSGDFTSSSTFFRWYIWLIDSSNNFVELYHSIPTYSSYLLHRSSNLASSQIYSAWGGMIEDSTGHQEDPQDILRFAVGLAPTLAFENYTDSLEGQVTVTFTELTLILSQDGLYDYLTEPDYEYKLDLGYYSPVLMDIEVDNTDSLYAVGGMDSYLSGLTLMKFDRNLNLVWERGLGYSIETIGFALTISPQGIVYVAGYSEDYSPPSSSQGREMFLAGWDSLGNLVLNYTYSLPGLLIPTDIAYSEEGSLYIAGRHYNATTHRESAFLLKSDLSGVPIWYQVYGSYFYGAKVVAARDGTAYLLSNYGYLTAWNSTGFQMWNGTVLFSSSMSLDSDDNLFTVLPYLGGDLVSKYYHNQTQIWNSTWGTLERYQTVYYTEPIEIDTTADGISYVFGRSTLPYVIKRGLNGSIVNVWSFKTDASYPYSHAFELGDGIFYILGTYRNSTTGRYVSAIIGFEDLDAQRLQLNSTTFSVLIVSISTTGLCIIIILGIERNLSGKLKGFRVSMKRHTPDSMEVEG